RGAPAALAVHPAGAVGQPDRLADRLLRHELLAARLRLPGQPAGVAVPGRGGRGGPDRLGHGLFPVLDGRPRQAGHGPALRIGEVRRCSATICPPPSATSAATASTPRSPSWAWPSASPRRS